MIRYSGGVYVNSQFTSDGTKQQLTNSIETALLSAGFTTISGSGTTNLLMQSAATPYPHQMRFRFKPATNTVCISLENVSGSIAGANGNSNGVHLLPANGQVFQVVACKYQFFIFGVGILTARSFAYGSVPFVPTWLTATDAGILMGNDFNDSNNAIAGSFRTVLNSNNCPLFQAVWHTTLTDAGNDGQIITQPMLVLPVLARFDQATSIPSGFYTGPIHWPGLNTQTFDAYMCWAVTSSSEVLIRCQLWNALTILDAFTNEATFTFDTHSWINITGSNVGSSTGLRGSVVIVTA